MQPLLFAPIPLLPWTTIVENKPSSLISSTHRRPRRNVAKWTMCPTDPAAKLSTIRDMKLLAVPMTQGGDVLFPGGSKLLSLNDQNLVRQLKHVAESDPPEFAYLPVNAWGDPAPVGTIAVLDDLKLDGNMDEAKFFCRGVTRFHVVHLAEKMDSARIEIFHDDDPEDADLDELSKLEEQLVETMTQIVRLSIKISDVKDEARQMALAETLKRVEAFCGEGDHQEDKSLLQHWFLDLSPKMRREILSFIVIDLVSMSFMDRRNCIMATNTLDRLAEALRCLQPFVSELAAKGAIVSALGNNHPDDTDPFSSTV